FLESLGLERRVGASLQRFVAVWPQGEGVAIGVNGVSAPPGRQKRIAAIENGFEKIGPRRQHFVIARDGVVETAKFGQRVAAIVPGFGKAGIGRECLLRTCERFGRVLLREEKRGAIAQRFGEVRSDGNCFVEGANGLRNAAFAGELTSTKIRRRSSVG